MHATDRDGTPPDPGGLDEGLERDIPGLADELAVLEELVALDDKDILELGCGRAEATRAIAGRGRDRRITALEVDEVQHEQNLAIVDLLNVHFGLGGAEAIPRPDASADVVLLFKSLHHVPVLAMDRALAEIARVLRPGGCAWISEPLFRGEFNDVLRIFHDESAVRRAAFLAIVRAVDTGLLQSERQVFLRAPVHFADFEAFEHRVLGVTHTRHVLSAETLQRVREAFARYAAPDGAALFRQPLRIDLLRKPPAAGADRP